MSHEDKPGSYVRPENLVKAVFGIDYKGLTQDERAMQSALVERYRKRGLFLLSQVQAWREKHPDASYADAIHSLYEEEQQAELAE